MSNNQKVEIIFDDNRNSHIDQDSSSIFSTNIHTDTNGKEHINETLKQTSGTDIRTSMTNEPHTLIGEIGKTQYTHLINTHFRDIQALRQRINELETEINRITNLSNQVIVVEEISKKEAKEKIESYFIEHGEADIEELLTNLKIPLRTIIEVIEELKQEGKLVPEDEK